MLNRLASPGIGRTGEAAGTATDTFRSNDGNRRARTHAELGARLGNSRAAATTSRIAVAIAGLFDSGAPRRHASPACQFDGRASAVVSRQTGGTVTAAAGGQLMAGRHGHIAEAAIAAYACAASSPAAGRRVSTRVSADANPDAAARPAKAIRIDGDPHRDAAAP